MLWGRQLGCAAGGSIDGGPDVDRLKQWRCGSYEELQEKMLREPVHQGDVVKSSEP